MYATSSCAAWRHGGTIHGILVGLAVLVLGAAFFYKMLRPHPLVGSWIAPDGITTWVFSADQTVATQMGDAQMSYKWFVAPHRLTLVPRTTAKSAKPIRLTWSLDPNGKSLRLRDSATQQLYEFERQ